MSAARWERDAAAPGPRIGGFAGRGISVDGVVYEGVLLTPERAEAWQAPPLAALSEAHLAPLLAIDPEFILLGTGAGQIFAPRALAAALDARGIGIEAMDSRAAARTWGVLRAEGRWIAAAIMPL